MQIVTTLFALITTEGHTYGTSNIVMPTVYVDLTRNLYKQMSHALRIIQCVTSRKVTFIYAYNLFSEHVFLGQTLCHALNHSNKIHFLAWVVLLQTLQEKLRCLKVIRTSEMFQLPTGEIVELSMCADGWVYKYDGFVRA